MVISDLLVEWYEREKRDLPWRETKNPYKIWVSEIILQQTRVNQGMDYYYRFISEFPDIQSLAESSEDKVLKVWQGLGYYSRARNMHKAANQIVKKRNGIFPNNYTDLLSLKGIGPYTAGAIASLAFGQKVPAIDGNVKRVLSRFAGIDGDLTKKQNMNLIEYEAVKLLENHNPGTINQALMDLGAMVCKPSNPLCQECPLNTACAALQGDRVSDIPFIYKKNKKKIRHLNYYIIINKQRILGRQREKNDIWRGLTEFPLIESTHPKSEAELIGSFCDIFGLPASYSIEFIEGPVKHILSHQNIFAFFIGLQVDEKFFLRCSLNYQILDINKLDQPAWPRLIDRFLEKDLRERLKPPPENPS